MILVIGGAGYVGSYVVRELLSQHYRVVVLDDLSTGDRRMLDSKVIFEKGDFRNLEDVELIFSRYSIDAVMHCAEHDMYGIIRLLYKMFEKKSNILFSPRI
ncbi:NAD-dependent epimerase/dehydratase family protein [Bacillus cereus]